jgi:hypothetical protein
VRLPPFHFRWPLLGAFVGGIWAERARPLGLPGIVTDAPGGIGLSYIMVIAAVLAGGFLFVVAAGLFEHVRLTLRHQHGQRPAKAPGPREGVAQHQYRRAYPGSLPVAIVQLVASILVVVALPGYLALIFVLHILDRYGWLFLGALGAGTCGGMILGLLMPRVAPKNAAWDWGVRIGAILALGLVALLPLPAPGSPGMLIGAVLVSLSLLTGVSCGIGLLAVGLATLREGAGGRP